jgi:hypothetical protein
MNKKDVKQMQSAARMKSIRSRLSVANGSPRGSPVRASVSRNLHPKLHSMRISGKDATQLAEDDYEEEEDDALSSARSQQKLTRSKLALSVTPDLFTKMKASQNLAPNVISKAFMERQKSRKCCYVRFTSPVVCDSSGCFSLYSPVSVC